MLRNDNNTGHVTSDKDNEDALNTSRWYLTVGTHLCSEQPWFLAQTVEQATKLLRPARFRVTVSELIQKSNFTPIIQL